MGYCPNCGKELGGEYNFCPYCGRKTKAAYIKPSFSLPKFQFDYRMCILIVCSLIVIFSARFPLVKTVDDICDTLMDGNGTQDTMVIENRYSYFDGKEDEQGLQRTVYFAFIVTSAIMLLSIGFQHNKATKFFGIIAGLLAAAIFLIVFISHFKSGTRDFVYSESVSFFEMVPCVRIITSSTYPTIAGTVMCVSILVHFMLVLFGIEEAEEDAMKSPDHSCWDTPTDHYLFCENDVCSAPEATTASEGE